MCDNKNHNLVEIYRDSIMGDDVYNVVNWCEDCGAVVVDVEVDGRINPGKCMKMIFPKEIKRIQNG
jgi:valyl-tRNA synthetase